MQKFKTTDGGATDGTAIDRDGFNAGTKYLAKVINDNQWNIFEVVEGAGYTLIDGDISQVAKAIKAPYNPNYTYNTSAIATQTVSDVVKGSDGHHYEVLADAIKGDDPVTNVNNNWKKLPFKVADAINADEAVSKGQLLTEIKAVDGAGSGLDADLLRGLPADFTSSKATNGYQKLPSGLIIQWGTDGPQSQAHNSQKTLTFPIAFPNAVIKIITNSADPSTNPASVAQVNVISNTLSSMNTIWSSQSGATITAERVYLAIGY